MSQRVRACTDPAILLVAAAGVFLWVRHTMRRIEARKQKQNAECLQSNVVRAAAKGDNATLIDAFKRLDQMDPLLLEEKVFNARDRNGWTVFQLAAANGHTDTIELLLATSKGVGKDQEDEGTQKLSSRLLNDGAPLILSLVNRHDSTAQLLVEQGASLDVKLRRRNAIYLAGLGGSVQTAKTILAKHGENTFCQMANDTDDNGYNALYAAALGDSTEMCQLFLNAGVSIKQASTDGSSAIHAACRGLPQRKQPKDFVLNQKGKYTSDNAKEGRKSAIDVLLSKATINDLLGVDAFGSTPLHLAAANANIHVLKSILSHFQIEDLIAQDNDGLHPIHSACNELCRCAETLAHEKDELAQQQLKTRSHNALECMMELLRSGYPLNARDYADATALHILCYRPTQVQWEAMIEILALLSADSHYSRESILSILEAPDCYGWTCLHQAFQTNGACSQQLFFLLCTKVSENFLAALNPSVAKIDSDTYQMRRGAHNRIPIQIRKQILDGNFSPQGVAKRLLSLGRKPRVTVLLGAGVSTSAGIKDFRGSNGLCTSSNMVSIMSEEAIRTRPTEFYGMVRDMFLPVVDGTIKPTRAHALLKVFKDKGWLHRVYTQNVDTLEYPLLDPADVVECHGSFRTARCINPDCDFRIESHVEMQSLFWDRLREGSDAAKPAKDAHGKDFPVCSRCSAPLRPAVTFFGEGMPAEFHLACKKDVPESDLVLVMGTSLVVYPVAGLPQMANSECVRMLINHKPTGCFQYCPPWNLEGENRGAEERDLNEEKQKGEAKDTSTPFQARTKRGAPDSGTERWAGAGYRDVFLRGGCDQGAQALAAALGWGTELQAIVDGLAS